MDKRGQNSTIAVTIAIVLGIALIVFLIWGFSTNWNLFRSTSNAYTGTTLDIVKDACQRQCDSGSEAEFCRKKDVVMPNGKTEQKNCVELGVECDITC